MVLFLANKFSVYDFIALVAHEVVQGLDDGLKIKAFRDRLDHVLTFWAAVVVIRTLEDEAECLWHEANVASFAPAQ